MGCEVGITATHAELRVVGKRLAGCAAVRLLGSPEPMLNPGLADLLETLASLNQLQTIHILREHGMVRVR